MSACPFCSISGARLLNETENAVAFVDPRNGAEGYTLAAPRRHVGSISQLSPAEVAEMEDLLKWAQSGLEHASGGAGIAYDALSEEDESGHACVVLVPKVPPSSDSGIKEKLRQAKQDYADMGGWDALKSGEWLLILIKKSFRNYWERANVEYFTAKYGTQDKELLAAKLIKVAAQNSAILGSLVGVAVSADEVVAVVTGGEGLVGLPANLAIAAAGVGSEAILLMRLQLQLVANLAKLYEVPLDPDDPEDILTIIAFALGGSAAEAAGKIGMKLGSKAAGRAAKEIFKKEMLQRLKDIGKLVGVKVLQRSIVKYTVPIVSIVIGTGWNYSATKTVGRLARKHFLARRDETKS